MTNRTHKSCGHFDEQGLPIDLRLKGVHGEALLTEEQRQTAIASYRCPCERGSDHPDPNRIAVGYPFQPHTV